VAPRIVMYNVHYIQYLLSSSLQNYSNFGFIFFLVSFFSLLKY
jgi:hypothetical protein